MNKIKLALGVVLPSDTATCDGCIGRLLEALRREPGVSEVHVDQSDPEAPKLCLHFDPQIMRVETIRATAERAGLAVSTRFGHLSVPVTGIRHARQAKLVEGVFQREPGVVTVSVGSGAKRIYLEFDPSQTDRARLLATARRAGIDFGETPSAEPEHDHDHAHGGIFGERTELVFTLACGFLTGVGWILEKLEVSAPTPTVLFIAAYALGSWFTAKELIVALRARQLEVDFLMLLAAVGAAILGEWLEGALLLFLFSLGHALEGYAMGRARAAIESLSNLAPEVALRVQTSGPPEEVAVGALQVGDRLLVKPNTRIPSDGFVVAGNSSVDQAPITGESVAVDKRPVVDEASAAANLDSVAPEHRVFAGTINGGGVLTIAVTKLAADSTLARMVKLVSEAETQKSPSQRFTDRFERVFVPVILAVVVLLLFAWVVIDEPIATSVYRAIAVLVAASPCALAIATPSAVLSGVARAARSGVLIKGGAHLEALGSVQAVAFDKTGTLTEGKPQLTDVSPFDGASEEELLVATLAVERQSDHPLAHAIVSGGTARLPNEVDVPEASEVEAIIGFGVRAKVSGASILIGKPGLFDDGSMPERLANTVEALQRSGRTVMIVKRDDRFLGVLGVMDTPRDSAREVVAELHRLGITESVMLTGDNRSVGEAVAAAVGIRVVHADLLPEQKVAVITRLSEKGVAMIGDGVNDAPALAAATVGIAMGAGGSDVALETADIALMADDLRALPFAVGLSRAARTIIRQNLFMSLGMVVFLIPATILGIAEVGVAVALHEGSTLLVVANALRLLRYRTPIR